MTPLRPDRELVDRITRLAGGSPVAWVRRTGGYTPAERWVATLPDGSSVFIKMATTRLTARWLRQEVRIYESLNVRCVPNVLAWEEHEERPLLVMQDLTYAHWPPPWTHRNVEAVLEALAEVAAAPVPGHLPAASDTLLASGAHWGAVADDPADFLSLGLCSVAWLERSLPTLLAAEARAPVAGDALLHLDVRSDNLCFGDEDEAILIDWSHASRGAAKLDVAFLLPSLQFEGGPAPETVMPAEPEYAAFVSGFFAGRAGQPVIPLAPFVRRVQREQLSTALPWAIRALELPPLDGAA